MITLVAILHEHFLLSLDSAKKDVQNILKYCKYRKSEFKTEHIVRNGHEFYFH